MKTELTSLGFPMSLSAKTFKDASVGSPTFENCPFESTLILEVLLKMHPILSVSIKLSLLALGFFYYSALVSYLHPIGS